MTHFIQDNDGYVIVYVDGSCKNNGQSYAKAGFGVWFNEKHYLNKCEPVKGPATNNHGEIQAATSAIRAAGRSGIINLRIMTDSMFLLMSMTKWMQIWRRTNWTMSNGQRIKNYLDFRFLDQAMYKFNSMNIDVKYVPAHSGCEGNEKADLLAKNGAQKYRIHKFRNYSACVTCGEPIINL